MLYKQIHITTNFFEAESRAECNYAFSLDTFVESDELTGILMVELDSILRYVDIDNQDIDILLDGVKFLQHRFTYKKHPISGFKKTFVCYDYLNVFLVQILNYVRQNGLDNHKLIQVIENLDNTILNAWDSDITKIKKVFESLDITYKSDEYKHDGYITSMCGLINMFSNRI